MHHVTYSVRCLDLRYFTVVGNSFYLRRFDYTLIIILLPEDYQSIIETLQIKKFDNYCEVFKIKTLYCIGERYYG